MPRQDDLAFFSRAWTNCPQYLRTVQEELSSWRRGTPEVVEAGGSGERSSCSVLWAPSRLSWWRGSILPLVTPSHRQTPSSEMDASNSGSWMDPAARRLASGSFPGSESFPLLVQAIGEASVQFDQTFLSSATFVHSSNKFFFQGTNC
jgi:hypothetical protein